MDYKLYDHGTRDFLGWLRNQGALSAGDKLRWAGKDWQIKTDPRYNLDSETPVWQTASFRKLQNRRPSRNPRLDYEG